VNGLIRYAICFTMGALVGPILIAGGLSIFPGGPADDAFGNEKSVEASRLIDAYRARLPRGILFTSMIAPPNGKECGYDPDTVFPGGMSRMGRAWHDKIWVDYAGYYALNQWRWKSWDDAWISEITQQIGKDMSLSRIRFLRLCIESTVVSRTCMAEVEKYGDRVERFNKERENPYTIPGGHEDRVVCTYVDGVAARRGLPLSPAFDQKLADRYRLGGN
jgi:hypothetical protein